MITERLVEITFCVLLVNWLFFMGVYGYLYRSEAVRSHAKAVKNGEFTGGVRMYLLYGRKQTWIHYGILKLEKRKRFLFYFWFLLSFPLPFLIMLLLDLTIGISHER